MSSVVFQPLLHDPLGWKSSNTTYADTFTWKNYRPTNKDKRVSKYGQRYQKQIKKQQQQTNVCLSLEANEEQTIQPVIVGKKFGENRDPTPASVRSSPWKTPTPPPPPVVNEGSLTPKQRPASINREATCGSRGSQQSPVITEETRRPATSSNSRRSPSKEEKEKAKEKIIIDPNNDNSRHWLTYPNPKTPDYLIDIKQRLGQLKIPRVFARPASVVQSESAVPRLREQQPAEDHRHLFDFNLPQTPDELRASRHRLERHRYNPALDNYPPRPQTCPVPTHETPQPVTPPNVIEFDDEQLPPLPTSTTPPVQTKTPTPPPPPSSTAAKDDGFVNDEENKIPDNETSISTLHTFDMDGLPCEYIEAVEIASNAQEEYWRSIKTNPEKKSDSFVYRLPALSGDASTESITAYRNQQQSTSPTNNNSTRVNEFDSWVRNATDQERASAMKILRDVLRPSIMGYEIPIKQQPRRRAVSAPRKLGRTRNPHRRIPCEICEKEMIKRHVWNLNQSDKMLCPHQAHGFKAPLIEIRTS